ncbi:MAG: hypothetical protein QOJ07_112 [Thermoleophilaceae bacterium]|nr:hypothetical protein [Thermoleophilaceae bacterium]
MRKELRPTHDLISCDVCGRTILKGERVEAFLAPGGQRKSVCQLCVDSAHNEGWIRESAHMDSPASLRRPEPRRGLLGRFRRGQGAGALPSIDGAGDDYAGAEPGSDGAFDDAGPDGAQDQGGGYEPEPEAAPPPPPPPRRSQPKDPRHVRAVPTNAQVKVERALELFNKSAHPKTIAGIARTLGEPWVCALPLEDAPSEVSLVVAWELSWYRFRIDLGDEHDPVTLTGKGHELDELPEAERDWNATAVGDGRIGVGVRSGQ